MSHTKETLSQKKLSKITTPTPSGQGTPKGAVVVVSQYLEDLDMDHEQKIELTKKYTEEELEIAVPRCLSWPARANDYHGMMTVLKKSSTWVDKVDAEKKVKDNEAFLKTLFHLDMQTVGGMRIDVGPSYIQFVCGPKSTVFEVSDLEFKEKTKEQLEFLQKRGGEKSPRQ